MAFTWLSLIILINRSQRISSFVDDKTAEAFRKNQRIKKELGIHRDQQNRSLQRIADLETKNAQLRAEKKQWEKENDLKDSKSRMTCTPDMEFSFGSTAVAS